MSSETPRTDAQLSYDEDDPVSADFARQLERELSAALARVAELEADARRYRWLRDQAHDDGCVVVMKEKHIPRFSSDNVIDAYIDAALAKEGS